MIGIYFMELIPSTGLNVDILKQFEVSFTCLHVEHLILLSVAPLDNERSFFYHMNYMLASYTMSEPLT